MKAKDTPKKEQSEIQSLSKTWQKSTKSASENVK
jgi:hypothetical protein